MLPPTSIDANRLETRTTPRDLRKDLMVFMDYVEQKEIKRTYRNNHLPKTDYKRLAKLMQYDLTDDLAGLKEGWGVPWIDFVDEVALKLKFISYDTEGEYAGYSSSAPSFRNNYIQLVEGKWQRFLELPALLQEQHLIELYRKPYTYNNNELIKTSIHSWLDPFNGRGCATATLPLLNFALSRSDLMKVLQEQTEAGQWYTIADLTAYMKKHKPWFLIPKKVQAEEKNIWNRKKKNIVTYKRYQNFYETDPDSHWVSYDNKPIDDDDPKGFEKVEGRFIERFLESFVFTLGYVDLAYLQDYTPKVSPSIGHLQAFRFHPVFYQIMKKQPILPKVTIQPNFEIYIESPIYPIHLMNQLWSLTNVVKEDRQIIVKLNKSKVLNELVETPDFDIIKFLRGLSDRPIPQNILMELTEWGNKTEAFILYEGYGIYEGAKNNTLINDYKVTQITPTISIVQNPLLLLKKLEHDEQVPLGITHDSAAFRPLPTVAKSIFPKEVQTKKAAKPTKVKASIIRQEEVMYTIANTDLFQQLLAQLLKAKCSITIDKAKQQIRFLKTQEPAIKKIVQTLKNQFTISVKKGM